MKTGVKEVEEAMRKRELTSRTSVELKAGEEVTGVLIGPPCWEVVSWVGNGFVVHDPDEHDDSTELHLINIYLPDLGECRIIQGKKKFGEAILDQCKRYGHEKGDGSQHKRLIRIKRIGSSFDTTYPIDLEDKVDEPDCEPLSIEGYLAVELKAKDKKDDGDEVF